MKSREAINKAENTGIIFIDEIDKISGSSSKGGGPDVSREGTERSSSYCRRNFSDH